MSGIVGMVNLNGSPVDRELLDRMTAFLSFRGPDAQSTWAEGRVGLGHTLLRTTDESEHEQQPCSLDGQVWITADARIDDRANLIDKLTGHGRRTSLHAPDVELILHAYHVWGEQCVEHLLGDFSFAIWDGRERRLFCACDHFGIKPFYYAPVGTALVVSNTLNCVRYHPDVSDELNDAAIADFLLFGWNAEPETTTFTAIRRLLPAHILMWDERGLRVRRYWEVTVPGEVRYKRSEEYVERFRELLRTAVADRVRTSKVGVIMSGGLDSTAVAAVARDVLADKGAGALRAFTCVYDRLVPDQERHFAELAAQGLGIPIQFLLGDDYGLYERSDHSELRPPEVTNNGPFLALWLDGTRMASAHSRVALSGWDGDTLLCEFPPAYFGGLWKGRRVVRLAADLWRYLLSQRELPPVGFRSMLKRRLGLNPRPKSVAEQTWVNPDFAARWNFRARQDEVFARRCPVHPRRPTGFGFLNHLASCVSWDMYDPGVTGILLEQRHPLLDLRLMRYALSIPPVPWCMKKKLLRLAMRGILPEPVRLRPKTPFTSSPALELLRRGETSWMKAFHSPVSRLGTYVDLTAIPTITRRVDPKEVIANLRSLDLAYWLRSLVRTQDKGDNDAKRIQTAHRQLRSEGV